MRLFPVLTALAFGACTPVPTTPYGPSISPPDSLSEVVERAAGAYYGAAPQAVGLSVGVIVGDEIRTFHFGVVEPGGRAPNDGTVYAVGSVTKTVTGSLLAQAALEGRLDLDDDVRDYLDEPYSNLQYEGHPVRIAHLVNHNSGLPSWLPDRPEMYPDHLAYDGDMGQWMAGVTRTLRGYRTEDFLRDLRAVRLDTIPGTRFSYSNAGAQLAGLVLERVYGRPFAALVDSLVADPLGMDATDLGPRPGQQRRLATGFDERGRPMPPVPTEAYGAAGGLVSTAADLSRYAWWHLDESDPVVRLSHTPPGGDPEAPARGYAVGLNWQMLRSADGVRRVWQDGNVAGFSARVVVYPELDIGVIVLTNELDRSIPELTDRLADTVLESLDTRTFTFQEGL